MADDDRVLVHPAVCDTDGLVFDEDGTVRRTAPCACLPGSGSDAMEGWLECASCGLRQRPGKEWCGFCGRRWVTAGRDGA